MDLRDDTLGKCQKQGAQRKSMMASFSPTILFLPFTEGEGPIGNVQTGQHPAVKSRGVGGILKSGSGGKQLKVRA